MKILTIVGARSSSRRHLQCGIITVTGDTGYYVPYGDPEATAEAIRCALADTEKGKLARERIIKLFPLERREKALVEIIEGLFRKR